MSRENTPPAAEFSRLPFPSRMRALAAHARSLDDAGYRAERSALDAGSPDDRVLALFFAVVRRDLEAVTAALDDPLLRRRALSAAIHLPVPERALSSLALSPVPALRRDLYKVLRLSRRRAAADRLLPRLRAAYGPAEAARLLPACSASAVAEWLPRFADTVPLTVLGALTRTAPGPVAAHLAETVGDSAASATTHDGSRPDRRGQRAAYQRLVTLLAERAPDAALLLVERTPWLLTERATAVLLRRPRPLLAAVQRRRNHRLEQLPLASGPLSRSARRALRALDPQEIAELATLCTSTSRRGARRPGGIRPEPLLLLLPPGDRRRHVEARMPRGARPHEIPLNAVAALEPADRVDLVSAVEERHRRSGGFQGRLPGRFRALLPLAEAEEGLREETASHLVHGRAAAWPLLLACARLNGDPAEYARVVSSCERAWHDQDHVRGAALAEAAESPRALLAAVRFDALRDAAMTAVQSRDSTRGTLAAAERWLRRTAEAAAAHGDVERASAVALLLADVVLDPRRAGEGLGPLRIESGAARAIWSAAAPETIRPRRAVALAGLLAGHASTLEGADALLLRTAKDSRDRELAELAADIRLRDPATREAACAELLEARGSLITVPRLLRTVLARRTDLLAAVSDEGSSASGEGPSAAVSDEEPSPSYWVPSGVTEGLRNRWLPDQRAAFDARLARIAEDEDAPLRERSDAAGLLRNRPALLRLAARAQQPVAAAALTALGEPSVSPSTREALALLLPYASAGGVRGRAAMAVVRVRQRALTEPEAVDALGPVARDTAAPVGTRKDAARALAERQGETAFDALLAAWDAPGQHRDVLAVLATPLLTRVDRPGVRERLAAAAHHPAVLDTVVSARAAPRAEGLTAPARTARVQLLVALVRDADRTVARTACGALQYLERATVPLVADALGAVMADTTRPREVRAAAAITLLRQYRHEAVATALPAALDALTHQARAGDEEEVRRSALTTLAGLESAARELRQPPLLDMITDALESAGLRIAAARTSLLAAMAAIGEGEPGGARWDRCLALAGDHAQRLGRLPWSLVAHAGRKPSAALEVVVAALSTRGTAADAGPEVPGVPEATEAGTAGLIAVTLAEAAGQRTDWSSPWPEALAALVDHPDPDVAEAALMAEPERGM